jgi:hypothetical protein
VNVAEFAVVANLYLADLRQAERSRPATRILEFETGWL